MTALRNQQRRYRNVSRRWVNGYVGDETMVRAAWALAGEYEDAATWRVDSFALQSRYYRLADQYRALAASLNPHEYPL